MIIVFMFGKEMYLIMYVDYLLISGSNVSEIEDLKKQLSKQFEMSDCGPLQRFLGAIADSWDQSGD